MTKIVCIGEEEFHSIDAFYMGKNTPDRQDYIIENLREDVDKQIEVAVA